MKSLFLWPYTMPQFSAVKELILIIAVLCAFKCDAQRSIIVNNYELTGTKPGFINNCIGAGRAYEGLRADWQEQLRETVKDCGFKYIRFHGLFEDEMGVYTEDNLGKPVYNWQYIDKLYDFLLSIHIKPFVELSFTPSALKSSDKTVFFWKAYVGYPKDYNKWADLVNQFVKHLDARYGKKEVSQWYFEVWNEPNHKAFSTNSSFEEYSKFYKITAEAVKQVSNAYQIGGPATAGVNWIKELIDYCNQSKTPLDFISTHTYGIESFFDEYGTKGSKLKGDPDAIVKDVNLAASQTNSRQPGLPLHFTEWSTSSSSRDPVHDTYQNAAYILNTLHNINNKGLKSMSYWVFTDIFEEAGPAKTPFHGGFGLLNLQNIKKPTYFVYKFLNEAGTTELHTNDDRSWAFKSSKGMQLLFWDFTLPKQDAIDQVFFRRELPPTTDTTVSVKATNLNNGKYQIEVYRVGYKSNDVFTAYFKMGLPAQLTPEQIEQLKKSSDGHAAEKRVVIIANGHYNKTFKIRTNDILFLKLTKIN